MRLRIGSRRCGGLLVIASFLTLLSSGSWAQSPYQGCYFGTTTGVCEDGAFGIAVREDGSAIIIRMDDEDSDGGVKTDVTIAPDGTFSVVNIDGEGTNVSGTISGETVSGTIDEVGCPLGTFAGTKASGDPLLMNGEAGLYRGDTSGTVTVDGVGEDTLSGTFDLLVAADGQSFGYTNVYAPTFDAELSDGGPLFTTSNGGVTGTFLAGVVVSGNLNLASGDGTGSANFSGFFEDFGATGTVATTWNVSRTEVIPCPEPGVNLLAGTALLIVAGLRLRWRRRS